MAGNAARNRRMRPIFATLFALADTHVQKFLAGFAVKKVIVVPGKIVNIAVA